MIKFERVLSDAELISATFKAEAEGTMGELRAVEQAVLAKLAEQEPIAWTSEECLNEPCFVSDEDGLGWAYKTKERLLDDFCGFPNSKPVPLYAHPMPCVSTANDKAACVSESGESETQESAPFTPKTVSEMRSFIGMHFDSLQYANPETEEPDEMDRYTLTIHDLLSAFDWAGHYDCDHIADMRKKVPEGWQLVPIEPTDSMLASARYARQRDQADRSSTIYRAMLAAAPKYTGDSNE